MKNGLIKAGLLFSSVLVLAACSTTTDDESTQESEVQSSEVQTEESGSIQDSLTYEQEDPRAKHVKAGEQHYLVASEPIKGTNWGYMLEAFSNAENEVTFTYFYYLREGVVLESTKDVKSAYKVVTGEEAKGMSDEEIVTEFNKAARKVEAYFVENQSLEGFEADGIIEESVLENYQTAVAQLLFMIENPDDFKTAGEAQQEELEKLGQTESESDTETKESEESVEESEESVKESEESAE